MDANIGLGCRVVSFFFFFSYFVAVTAEYLYDRIVYFKEPVSDKILKGHVIRTERVIDEGSCRVRCFFEPNCVSVNVGPKEKDTHMCELNNSTDETPTLSALLEGKRYTYYGIEV